jgi:hypothetical protein
MMFHTQVNLGEPVEQTLADRLLDYDADDDYVGVVIVQFAAHWSYLLGDQVCPQRGCRTTPPHGIFRKKSFPPDGESVMGIGCHRQILAGRGEYE